MTSQSPGKLGWIDLTVEDANATSAFYSAVCGWTAAPHPMGDYNDFNMEAEDGSSVSGICHARGMNANIPPVWMPYFLVPSLENALETVRANGGTVLEDRSEGGGGGIAIIRDPNGAHCALWQAG
ncbi:MAG: VOC family protein [Pseudomonadota bacterium]